MNRHPVTGFCEFFASSPTLLAWLAATLADLAIEAVSDLCACVRADLWPRLISYRRKTER